MLLKLNIHVPKILYYITTLAKHEINQVEGKEIFMKLVCEDRGPYDKNVKISRKCNAKRGIT